MQIVIDVPENEYGLIKEIYEKNDIVESTYSYIYHGTPLPKGHGRLIDADDAKREWSNVIDCEVEHPKYKCTIRDVLEDAQTIIEADRK